MQRPYNTLQSEDGAVRREKGGGVLDTKTNFKIQIKKCKNIINTGTVLSMYNVIYFKIITKHVKT